MKYIGTFSGKSTKGIVYFLPTIKLDATSNNKAIEFKDRSLLLWWFNFYIEFRWRVFGK